MDVVKLNKDNKNNVVKVNNVPCEMNPSRYEENIIGDVSEYFDKNLITFVKNTCETGVQNIIKEFQQLQSLQKRSNKTHKSFDDNIQKCRYKDICCYDDFRVHLQYQSQNTPENDFIHANYINSSNGNYSYIGTQAPLPNTINDFWEMIWQLNIKVIVMLCKVIENGKKKSEQYWPLDNKKNIKINNIQIMFLQKLIIDNCIVKTILYFTKDKVSRIVTHYQYLDWPDHGVPNNHFSCINLMKMATKNGPIVIHCSAGIGRTGTAICINEMLNNLSNLDGCIKFKDIVLEKREYRYGIVQTESQYLFLHRILISLAIQRKLIPMEEVDKFNQLCDITLNKLPHVPSDKNYESKSERMRKQRGSIRTVRKQEVSVEGKQKGGEIIQTQL